MRMRQPMRMSKALLKRHDASELTDLAQAGYFAELPARGLSQGPEAAVQRIAIANGVAPDRSGCNAPCIVHLRDKLWDLLHDSTFGFALAVTAPHTHWIGERPIIVSLCQSGYRVGHLALHAQGLYTPISFLLTDAGPLPYEWADDSLELTDAELERVRPAIATLCEDPEVAGLPLGLTLNFRFKSLFSEEPVTTVEYEESHVPGETASESRIARLQDVPHAWADPAFGQVAWHAFSDREFHLTEGHANLLAALRMRLGSLRNPADADRILQQALELVSCLH